MASLDVSTLEEIFEDADKEITHSPAESFQRLFWSSNDSTNS